MYQKSAYSGKLRNVSTNEVFAYDDRLPQFEPFLEWLSSGGQLESVPYFDGEELESGAIEALEKETQNYIQRANDGRDAYARISAEFRIAKLTGQISEQSHAAIEKTLIPVRDEVLAGQWISALDNLVLIGADNIGQQLYDRLYNQINSYIVTSYTTEEINAQKTSNVRK